MDVADDAELPDDHPTFMQVAIVWGSRKVFWQIYNDKTYILDRIALKTYLQSNSRH
jgi:hypothetical protein